MNKTGKFSVFLAALSIFTILLTTSVFAADGVYTTFVEKLSEILTNALGGSTGYDFVSNILSPQILFGLLVFLVVFAIVEQISLFNKNRVISVIISVVIGILAGGFINPAWIQPLLNQYEALGVAITFLIPFALIFYFLKEVAPTNQLVQKFVWVIYLIIVIITYFLNSTKIVGFWPTTIYIAAGVGSIIMLFWGTIIYHMFWENELDTAFANQQKIRNLVLANDKQKAYDALLNSGLRGTAEYNNLLRIIRLMPGPPTIP